MSFGSSQHASIQLLTTEYLESRGGDLSQDIHAAVGNWVDYDVGADMLSVSELTKYVGDRCYELRAAYRAR